jgi:hypothetical protein
MYRRCKTTFFAEVPAQKKFGPGTITFIPPTPLSYEKAVHSRTHRGFLRPVTALFVILSATSNEMTLSNIPAALFSSPGLMDAAIAIKKHGLPVTCSSSLQSSSGYQCRLQTSCCCCTSTTLWSHVTGFPAPSVSWNRKQTKQNPLNLMKPVSGGSTRKKDILPGKLFPVFCTSLRHGRWLVGTSRFFL